MDEHEAAVRAAAAAVAKAEAELDRAKTARNEAMAAARAAGSTWRALGLAAGMTEHGVRKALGHHRPGTEEKK